MRADTHNGRKDDTDAATLALMALAWTVGDERRADRLLALTGLDAGALRDGLGDPGVLGAVLGFLSDHEPDLIACAQALETTPEALIAAKEELNR